MHGVKANVGIVAPQVAGIQGTALFQTPGHDVGAARNRLLALVVTSPKKLTGLYLELLIHDAALNDL